MSISRSCILLFLLCLSLHACNARRLSSIDTKIPQAQKSLFSTKDHEGKSGVDEIAVSKGKCSSSSSSSKEKGELENNQVKTDHQTEEKSQTLKNRKTLRDISNERKGLGGPISVSWRVPHEKRGEKQPGFNLDYSPPKTHPPSHN